MRGVWRMLECYLTIEAGMFAAQMCHPWQIQVLAGLKLGLVALILGAVWHWRDRSDR